MRTSKSPPNERCLRLASPSLINSPSGVSEASEPCRKSNCKSPAAVCGLIVAPPARSPLASANGTNPRPVASPTSGKVLSSSMKVWLKLSAPPLLVLMT